MKQPADVQPSQILPGPGTFVLGVILFATAPSSVCAQEPVVSAAGETWSESCAVPRYASYAKHGMCGLCVLLLGLAPFSMCAV